MCVGPATGRASIFMCNVLLGPTIDSLFLVTLNNIICNAETAPLILRLACYKISYFKKLKTF